MPRTRLATRVALALVVVAAAVAVVVLAGALAGRDSEPEAAQVDPISATGGLDRRIVLFGDTLTATVDVVVDPTVIDPDDVEVAWSHEPWTAVGAPRVEQHRSGSTTYVRTTYVLRCLTVACVPVREKETVEFDPAEVSYAATVGSGTSRLSTDVEWPPLVVHTRISALDSGQRDALAAPWRADTVSLPAVSYRVSPGLVVALLVVVGGLLLAVAAVVSFRALPEREPPPEPEPPPPPVVSPLEQALALLESTTSTNGAQDRRRALELVAEALERWGDPDLAQTARTLAWSEARPEGEEIDELAARLRHELERELEQAELEGEMLETERSVCSPRPSGRRGASSRRAAS
jgi:hypothetical protein